jgi:hypothetical protein
MSTTLKPSNGSNVSIISPDNAVEKPFNGGTQSQSTYGLSRGQTVLAVFFLLSWLFLFAGGITMDTTKFRCVISPEGATQLAAEGKVGQQVEPKDICSNQQVWVPAWPAKLANAYSLGVSWLVVLLFFLPLNLAMISSAAGALGAFGNRANLEDDQTSQKSRDDSSPLLSGLLRGLFVYLFFISGLLLFDDKPFSSPGPGQYIRLAGFISLISFLVNYRPHLFATISDWAYERINSRKVIPAAEESNDEITLKKTTKVAEETEITIPVREGVANGDNEKSESSPIMGAAGNKAQ